MRKCGPPPPRCSLKTRKRHVPHVALSFYRRCQPARLLDAAGLLRPSLFCRETFFLLPVGAARHWSQPGSLAANASASSLTSSTAAPPRRGFKRRRPWPPRPRRHRLRLHRPGPAARGSGFTARREPSRSSNGSTPISMPCRLSRPIPASTSNAALKKNRPHAALVSRHGLSTGTRALLKSLVSRETTVRP
jgi:hypothetical protein